MLKATNDLNLNPLDISSFLMKLLEWLGKKLLFQSFHKALCTDSSVEYYLLMPYGDSLSARYSRSTLGMHRSILSQCSDVYYHTAGRCRWNALQNHLQDAKLATETPSAMRWAVN